MKVATKKFIVSADLIASVDVGGHLVGEGDSGCDKDDARLHHSFEIDLDDPA